MRNRLWLVTALSLASLTHADLRGQGSIVTPVQYATVPGPSSYTGAWHYTDRTQQIHGDLRNQNFTVNSIAWRRSAYPGTDPNSISRTIEIEFFAGEGDMNAAGANFVANYTTARTNVVLRKYITLPDFTQFQGAPSQFTFIVPFDQPLPYTGALDFVWEVIVWNNNVNSNYLVDACAGIVSLPGQVTYVGAGCTATGRILPMVETVSIDALLGPDRLVLEAFCANTPISAACALLIGATNPSLSFPSICTTLHTDALVAFQGTTSTLGSFGIGPLSFAHQSALVGQKLWLQFIAADAGYPFPFVLSNGASVEVPEVPPALPLVKLVRAPQQPTASVGFVYPYRGQIVRLGY